MKVIVRTKCPKCKEAIEVETNVSTEPLPSHTLQDSVNGARTCFNCKSFDSKELVCGIHNFGMNEKTAETSCVDWNGR